MVEWFKTLSAEDQRLLIVGIVTAAGGALLATAAAKIGGHLWRGLIWPFRAAGSAIYRRIAHRNILSTSLKRYRSAVLRSNLTMIENPLNGDLALPLADAFVPLRLIESRTERQDSAPADDADGGVDMDALRGPTVPGLLDRHGAVFVIGGPGTGKTTLMKHLLYRELGRGRNGENAPTPVFLELREMARYDFDVEAATVHAFADFDFPNAEQFVRRQLAEGKLLPIFDGLDEVGPNRDAVRDMLRTFIRKQANAAPGCKCVVTCRNAAFRRAEFSDLGIAVAQVLPFANEDIRSFLKAWPIDPQFADRRALDVFPRLRDDPVIADLCRNPLMLTILATLYVTADAFELPRTRNAFYEAALQELMTDRPRRRNQRQGFKTEMKRQLLSRISLAKLLDTAVMDGVPTVGGDQEAITRAEIAAVADALSGGTVDVDALLIELTDVNGVLRPVGTFGAYRDEAERIYAFSHRSFQEFLGAWHAKRSLPAAEATAQLADGDARRELLLMYASFLDNRYDVEAVLDRLQDRGGDVDAGRVLLETAAEPEPRRVATIAAALRAQIFSDSRREGRVLALEIFIRLQKRYVSELESISISAENFAPYIQSWRRVKPLTSFHRSVSSTIRLRKKFLTSLRKSIWSAWPNPYLKVC